MTRTLYICYFGMREPLVNTQVLPYLREVAKDGVEISLLTFEPNLSSSWTTEQIEAQRKRMAEQGIEWHMLPYHKRPSLPATAYDVLNGVRYIRKLLKKKRFDVFHARVHIPALIAVLVRKLGRGHPKILFDIRGFVPEEYADAGVWKKDGFLFRIAKRIERWIMNESDGFVVLTEAAREILFPESKAGGFDKQGRPIEVIPCCVDLQERFSDNPDLLRDDVRKKLGLEGRLVIVHVGSLTGLYLTPQIIDFLSVARKRDPSVFPIFLTQSDRGDLIKGLLAAGFSEDDFLVTKVDQEAVPGYLCASDIGLSFVKSSYATLSRSPTKIPEYLACGLPVIANRGVGDVDALIERNHLGAIVDYFHTESYEKALDEVVGLIDIRDRAMEFAQTEFDLETVGGVRYRRLYDRLLHPTEYRKTLYISYFGLREPLVQTQVIPYLKEVSKGKYPSAVSHGGQASLLKLFLLTFEPDTSMDFESMRSQMAEQGITWQWLPYHKRISAIATAWDILRGTFLIRRFIARERPDVLHARVHVPALMGALARKFSRHKPKLLFDIRGFFPEEYTDAGVWPENGAMYRTAKRVERWLMNESDGFVVLTQKARRILFPETDTEVPEAKGQRGVDGYSDKLGRPIEVIPCCVDFSRFSFSGGEQRRQARLKLGLDDRRVIVYVGSFGGWYLTDEMVDFFVTAHEYDPTTAIMVLTTRDKNEVIQKLRAKNFDPSDYFVESVHPEDLPEYLCAADIAVSFIMPSYSKKASSPTKNAEYLASGLPIICNTGIGDTDLLVGDNEIGILIREFSVDEYQNALRAVDGLGDVAATCREAARREFDLETVGGARYRRLYRRLLGGDRPGRYE